METAVLLYVALVGGVVLYRKVLRILLKNSKLRCVYGESYNFESYRIFYRFITFPWDYIRLTYEFTRVYRMESIEFFLYQCRHTDPEMYEKMVDILDREKNH
jgi:hypothetical protein